ncbi:hypothetical protein N0V88_001236 [Collariella sp. IMI 366227]|nr:hypothetical protein N0V88_001236 [Collariella sp. IMI 366227]
MPIKNRNYYLTTSPSRDFTWFPFKPRATPKVSKNKTEPITAYRVTKARRLTPSSAVKEPTQALMAPAEVKALAKAKPEASKPKKPAPKKPKPTRIGSKNAGAWSDWYVGEDYHYFWRARQTLNGHISFDI